MSIDLTSLHRVSVELAQSLKKHQYAIRGTASLVLQGLDMNVDDIDVICDKQTALACNEIWANSLVKPIAYSESDKFKSYFGSFRINKVTVEIMGEWQINSQQGSQPGWSKAFTGVDSEKTMLNINNTPIWVTTIDTELQMFSLMGRWNAYHKIKKQADTIKQQSLI